MPKHKLQGSGLAVGSHQMRITDPPLLANLFRLSHQVLAYKLLLSLWMQINRHDTVSMREFIMCFSRLHGGERRELPNITLSQVQFFVLFGLAA